jgi:hypothetical protein
MLNVYVPMVRSHEMVHTFAKPSPTLLMILFDPPKRFSTEFDPFLVGLVTTSKTQVKISIKMVNFHIKHFLQNTFKRQ